MLLLSETVSPALTGGDDSLVAGVVAAVSLMALCTVTELIAYRSRRFEKFIQGEAMVVIDDGKVDRAVMKRFMITDNDLRASLHAEGLLHVGEVKRAFVEADGSISIIKQKQ